MPFDDLFYASFKSIFDRVSFDSLNDMNQITIAEAKLASLGKDYSATFIESNDTKFAYLDQFLGREIKRSPEFQTMLDTIGNSNLIAESNEKMELLMAGSAQYDRYIAEHNLWGEEVVAILNDTSIDDVDLIFTVHGILVQKKQSKLWKNIRDIASPNRLIGVAKPLIAVMISAGLYVISLSGYVTRYEEIECSKKQDALLNPQYKSKNVNMKALCKLMARLKEYQVVIDGKGALLNQIVRAKADKLLLASPENVVCTE